MFFKEKTLFYTTLFFYEKRGASPENLFSIAVVLSLLKGETYEN